MSGVFLIEGSSLFAATLLVDSNNNSRHKKNPVGPLKEENAVLVYKSPVLSSSSPKSHSNNSIRLPPRLLLSPSQEFLCLFWHDESRYEILHVPSMLQLRKKGHHNYPPPVDFGMNVTSFAWVGMDDAFAILHVPTHFVKDYTSSNNSGSIKQTFSLKKESFKREIMSKICSK